MMRTYAPPLRIRWRSLPVIAATFLTFFAATDSRAQNERDRFNALMTEERYDAADSLVEAWARREPTNAEVYVARFNLYYALSRWSGLTLTPEKPRADALRITDKDTGEPVAYLTEGVKYDMVDLELGLAAIDEGIRRYPDRLDMHLGLVHVLANADLHERQTDAIMAMLDRGKVNGQRWTWTFNEPKSDGRELLIESVQGHVHELFFDESVDLLFIERIAQRFIDCFPEEVFGYSNLGACHLAREDYKGGIRLLEKAAVLAPDDAIVLLNLAHAHEKQGERKKALQRYEQVMRSGDAESKAFAARRIEVLQGAR